MSKTSTPAAHLDDPNHLTDLTLADADAARLRSRIAEYNSALHAAPDQADRKYPDLRLHRMNFHDRWDRLVAEHADHGFVRADVGALNDSALTDQSYTGPGGNYLFWDASHPTSRTHAVWAAWFQELVANDRLERLELVRKAGRCGLQGRGPPRLGSGAHGAHWFREFSPPTFSRGEGGSPATGSMVPTLYLAAGRTAISLPAGKGQG